MSHIKAGHYWLLLIIVCGMLLSYGCGCPPTQEIADAEVALSDARAAGAQIYATQEYESAESKLEKARKEVEKFHYTNARKLAIEAKDTAVGAKELAQKEKDRLRNLARQAILSAKETLTAAEIAGGKKYDPKTHNEIIALIGNAEMALSGEKFTIAIEKANEAQQKARRLELVSKRVSELEGEFQEAEKEEKPIPPPIPPKKPEQKPVYNRHIVKEGECLWIISEYQKVYANPFMWPLIYKANRIQIEDPDLIFPGQNFIIPRENSKNDIDEAIYKAKYRGPWSLYDGK